MADFGGPGSWSHRAMTAGIPGPAPVECRSALKSPRGARLSVGSSAGFGPGSPNG